MSPSAATRPRSAAEGSSPSRSRTLGPPVSQPLDARPHHGQRQHDQEPRPGQRPGRRHRRVRRAHAHQLHGSRQQRHTDGVERRAAASSRPTGSRELVNSTITGNSVASAAGFGGGISLDDAELPPFDGELEAINTIIAGNTVGRGGGRLRARRRRTVTDNNISGDDTCGFTDPGSKEDTDPQLFALRNNARADGYAELPADQPGAGRRHRHAAARPPISAVSRGPSAARVTSARWSWRRPPPSPTARAGSARRRSERVRHQRQSAHRGRHGGVRVRHHHRLWRQGALGRHGTTPRARRGARAAWPHSRPRPRAPRSPGWRANTTYHYRLVVQNADGIAFGADATFTTPSNAAPGGARPNVSVAGACRSGCVRRAFNLRVRAQGGERHAAEGRAGHARRPHDQAQHARQLHGARERGPLSLGPPHAADQGGGPRQPHAHGHPPLQPLRARARGRARASPAD